MTRFGQFGRQVAFAAIVIAHLCLGRTAAADAIFDLGGARLSLDDRGVAALVFQDRTSLPAHGGAAFELKHPSGDQRATSVRRVGDELQVQFEHGAQATFAFEEHPGFVFLRLKHLSAPDGVTAFQLFALGAPREARVSDIANQAVWGDKHVSIQAAELNVLAAPTTIAPSRSDSAGVKHKLELTREARVRRQAVAFAATSGPEPNGWSTHGMLFKSPRNLTGLAAIRAWIHGDGKGELLKFQLVDRNGGYVDAHQKIDFVGWRQLVLPVQPPPQFAAADVIRLNIYYNNLPANSTVRCVIDQIEALIGGARGRSVVLEDFEAASLDAWNRPLRSLGVSTSSKHGIEPAAFAVMACKVDEFNDVMPRLERAAGLPSPQIDGVWNKISPETKRSYLFLTSFKASQFDDAVKIARAGGFQTVLLGEESWCRSNGHFEIHPTNFPGGVDELRATVQRFHDAGIKVGLHFLCTKIGPIDPYITPVPDKRLYKGAAARLAAPLSETDTRMVVEGDLADFPERDGGYSGRGTVIQIGDELIQYGAVSKNAPGSFANCIRGHLGTRPAAHPKGATIRHLPKLYGYHLFDLETDLAQEVARNLAAVVEASGVDYVYFDGAEALPGDHWNYNPKLLKTYYDAFHNKNLLMQASSFNHYSWHMLARAASADGHGDLKGYLDERSPAFSSFINQRMPLDIGWYYGYDAESTLDQYEYILAQSIAYDSSISFQVSVPKAHEHPAMPQILDLIARYEALRLSGRVDADVRAKLRVVPELEGVKLEKQAPLLKHRREYRLKNEEGRDYFQRVHYGPWRELATGETTVELVVDVPAPLQVGVHVHARDGVLHAAGPAYTAADARVLEAFGDLATWTPAPNDRRVRSIGSPQIGSTSPGVTQQLSLKPGAKAGPSYAEYRVESDRASADGWSALTRTFSPPLNLSRHAGIGFWLKGDGRGGIFKLQLTDGKKYADFLIKNDYDGWRYQQLPRPKVDAIDYSSVKTLSIYANGVPPKTTVTWGIDDIKALGRLDTPAIANVTLAAPTGPIKLADRIQAGQYCFFWPGEEPQFLPQAPAKLSAGVLNLSLPAGTHTLKLTLANPSSLPVRARVVLQPDERLEIATRD